MRIRKLGEKYGYKRVSDRVEKYGPSWLGHVERIGEERMEKRVYDTEIIGRRGRGRPTRMWMDGVKDSLSGRSFSLEQA